MTKYYFTALLFLFILPFKIFSQHMELQRLDYSSRIINTVKVTVEKTSRDISFRAESESWYPYQLQIQFTKFINLTPSMDNYKTILHHGSNVLFTLKPLDAQSYYDYSYQIQYHIGYTNRKADTSYKYAIPLPEGKEIRLSSFTGTTGTIFFKNTFMLNSGDTVVSMRKGVVTYASPGNDRADRLVQSSTVEVLHKDGTVAIYIVPEGYNVLVRPGQEIYALQPIIVLQKATMLSVQMLQINDFTVRSLPFAFEYNTAPNDNFNEKIIKHSLDDAEQELSGREKKKMAKGELF